MDGFQQGGRIIGDAIPKEIMSVLPTDPSEQLELAHRLANLAFSSKVASLEGDNNQLRQTLMQRQSQLKASERKTANLELELSDAQDKMRQSMEEQAKLVGEKNALIGTVKKLNRDLAKLDSFKRNLLQSLQDEEEVGKEPAYVSADYNGDRLVQSVLSSVPHSSAAAGGTPPRYGTSTTPASVPSKSGVMSPGSAVGGAAPWTSGAGMGSNIESSPRVDGKEFFRQARARLAYEQFSQFLQNIKELNAHRQTREETLKRAQDIFGPDNADLYSSFEMLLSRHLPL
mmetsp:Transcript_9013/g.15474  ORF Transcript_9013/g.15474 Transcript_9013/m.15474 type:complete len:286 (-) Transcript_9013:370-1227(-)